MVLRQFLQGLTTAAVLLLAAPSVLHAQIALTGQVSSAEDIIISLKNSFPTRI